MQHRINTMLKSKTRDPRPVKINEDVYFWREDKEWIGPARVTKVNMHDVEMSHNGSTKSSSMNLVRKIENTLIPRNQLNHDETESTPSSFDSLSPDIYDAFPLDDHEDIPPDNCNTGNNTLHSPIDYFDCTKKRESPYNIQS